MIKRKLMYTWTYKCDGEDCKMATRSIGPERDPPDGWTVKLDMDTSAWTRVYCPLCTE